MAYILRKIFLDHALVSKKIVAEHFQNVAEAGAFVSFIQNEKAVIPAAHALFLLDLVVVSVKMFVPQRQHLFFPFQRRRKPE